MEAADGIDAGSRMAQVSQDSATPGRSDSFITTLLVDNIHCPSCVSRIQDILRPISQITKLDISILRHEVRVEYTGPNRKRQSLVDALEEAAFEVQHVSTYQEGNSQREEKALPRRGQSDRQSRQPWSFIFPLKQTRKHMKHCDACASGNMNLSQRIIKLLQGRRQTSISDDSLIQSLDEESSGSLGTAVTTSDEQCEENEHEATISIAGMTCPACTGKITEQIMSLDFVRDAQVVLATNSATITFVGPQDNARKVAEEVDDMGYEAELTEIKKPSKDPSTKERTVTIVIDGMYCQHCPARVLSAIRDEVGSTINISGRPTLGNPMLTITYLPKLPELTIRNLVASIKDKDDAFNPRVYHPPSLEDRSRAMQHEERKRIMKRLLFTFIVAIPTFIIGVVFMSLISKRNPSRRWLEQYIWAGSVTRMEWALLIMTTPVMFFGTDIFHRRAFTEVKNIWRPGSKVPLIRRFYRFGSMNLLISAGTSVAYFSSLAILIIAARRPAGSDMRGSATYFDSVTFLSFFILIGKFLEAYGKAKTGDAVASLSKLRPSEAILLTSPILEKQTDYRTMADAELNAVQERIAVDLLEAGDVVSVPFGTSPPADGIVLESGVRFNEASMTGESKPAEKQIGDKVYTGSINDSNKAVRIRVTDINGTSMLDQIIAVVRQGQAKRAPIERIADIITGYFVPIITLIAITTFLVWFALGQSGVLPRDWLDTDEGGWAFWSIEFAIAVFVVACPCGIGLAAPTALFMGGGLAAKHGILVQGGGEAFQEASRIDAIVFDKTGTLTEGGSLSVTDYDTMVPEADTESIRMSWALAKAMEEASGHPIAKAVEKFCSEKLESRPGMAGFHITSSEIKEISGHGMKGTFTVKCGGRPDERYEATIGNQKLVSSSPTNEMVTSTLRKYQTLGHSTAVLSLRKLSSDARASGDQEEQKPTSSSLPRPIIVFAISDPIRPSAQAILTRLQEEHKIAIHMCTGDNETTARTVATSLNIPTANIRASCLPADKAKYIQSLQTPSSSGHGPQRRQIIAFVGDGTNDMPALSASDVSIALASGSDVAVSSASFILLNSDLNTILTLVRLAKRVFGRVKMNFAWAAVYNCLLIPVAAGVFYPIGSHWRLNPVWASLAMALSSVSVVGSSFLLRWEWTWRVRGAFGRKGG